MKQGKRYRYYVSSNLLGAQQDDRSHGQRVPAGDVERAALDRLQAFYASSFDVSEALLPFRMTAPDLKRALRVSKQLSHGWLTQSKTDRRALVQSIVSQVMIKSDQIVVALDRSAVRRSLLDQHLNELKSEGADDDHGPLLLTIEARLHRAGKGIRIIIGAEDEPRPDPNVCRLLGEAFALRDQLLAGADASIEALSHRLGLARGYVTSRVRLTYLSPALVRSILNGEVPLALTANKLLGLTKDLPLDWTEQAAHLGTPGR